MVNYKIEYTGKVQRSVTLAPLLSLESGLDKSWDIFVFGSSSGKENIEENINVDDTDLDWFLDLPVPYILELDPSIQHG